MWYSWSSWPLAEVMLCFNEWWSSIIQRHEKFSNHWCLQSSRIFPKRSSVPDHQSAGPVHSCNKEELNEENRRMNTAAEKGRVKADNCCKTVIPLLLHAQEIKAVKNPSWALAMTFQISSSTAVPVNGANSYHGLYGTPPCELCSEAGLQGRSFLTASSHWHSYSFTWQLWKQGNPSHSAASLLTPRSWCSQCVADIQVNME